MNALILLSGGLDSSTLLADAAARGHARLAVSVDYGQRHIRELAAAGLKMHGFGVKTKGFAKYARYLTSADSLAWSERARRHGVPLPECVDYRNSRGQAHKNCANCLVFAKKWYARTLRTLAELPTEGATS